MLNYIRADLYRIYRQIPRYILLVLFHAGLLGYLAYTINHQQLNAIGLMSAVSPVYTIGAFLFGLMALYNVLSDDFRAKTMQMAIGNGVPRRKVVLAKFLETTLLSLLDLLLLTLLIAVVSTTMGIQLHGAQIGHLCVYVFCDLLQLIIIIGVTMIPMFYMQKTGLAGLLYIVFFLDPLNLVIGNFLASNKLVIDLHLADYTVSSLIGTLNTQLGLGASFPAKELILVILYAIVTYVITALVFEKQELEF